LFVGERAALGFLDGDGDRIGFAFVTQISQDGEVFAGPGGECGQDLGVRAQGGGVVLASGTDVGGPQRPAVGCGDDLDVPAVVGVFARPPQIHSRDGVQGAAAVGFDQRAIDADMAVDHPGFVGDRRFWKGWTAVRHEVVYSSGRPYERRSE
jgi:hypothetical protein